MFYLLFRLKDHNLSRLSIRHSTINYCVKEWLLCRVDVDQDPWSSENPEEERGHDPLTSMKTLKNWNIAGDEEMNKRVMLLMNKWIKEQRKGQRNRLKGGAGDEEMNRIGTLVMNKWIKDKGQGTRDKEMNKRAALGMKKWIKEWRCWWINE